ncbi:MAG: metal-dependent transcriptional regulator [Spirochaetales bacterium]|nr:MAG: metal-dependent transcriptional regulator [Spirochaetales bacterium]
MQMYLKAVHEIQSRRGAARVTDIARSVGVNKASVTSALRNLSQKELINYAPYDIITLTPAGVGIATEIERRYAVLNTFFVDVLGISPEHSHDNACNLEHHLSQELYDRLVGFIEYYTTHAESRFKWDSRLGGFGIDVDKTGE